MKNLHALLFILSGIIISACSLNLLGNNNLFLLPVNQNVYAHNFTPNESAFFLAFVEQLRAESELVQINLAENNVLLAQQHADKAAALLTPNVTREIAEQNQRVANDLTIGINDLQRISSSQQQSIDQLVNSIDAMLGEAVTTRIEQEQRDNATILALAFADLVDSILVNYGNAYAVEFDMTNMSNMAMTGSTKDSLTMDNMIASEGNNVSMSMESHNMSMESMHSSSSVMNDDAGYMNRNYSIVNMSNYQSAQALSIKALDIYNTELKPIIPAGATAFATNLENALIQLNDAIRNKSSPMDIMMITHMQIHPNLQQTFGLGLQ